MSARVRMRRDVSGLHVAAIDIPTACGAVRVTGVGGWFSDALSAASSVASRITSDPVMSAILPPQAALAINAVRKIASAAQQGAPALRGVMQQFEGPGKQRLARALHAEARRRGPDPMARAAMPPQRFEVPERAREEQEAEEQADDDQGGEE